MGNLKTLIISLVLTGFAMLLIMTYVDQREQEFMRGLGTMVSVVIARQNIKEGTILEPSMFTIQQFPVKYVQPNYLSNLKDLENTVAAIPLVKGEIITTNKLLFIGAKTGLAPAISKGKRAFKINAVGGVGSDLLKPGDRIDLLVALREKGAKGQAIVKVKTILQDILVLAIGTSIFPEMRSFVKGTTPPVFPPCVQKVTDFTNQGGPIIVEVSLKEAQIIVAALSKGSIYYVLRNPVDRKYTPVSPTTTTEILKDVQ